MDRFKYVQVYTLGISLGVAESLAVSDGRADTRERGR